MQTFNLERENGSMSLVEACKNLGQFPLKGLETEAPKCHKVDFHLVSRLPGAWWVACSPDFCFVSDMDQWNCIQWCLFQVFPEVGMVFSGVEDDDNNCVEFAANGGMIASETACMANHVSENLVKLCVDTVESIMEWCTDINLHWNCLSKLEEFCDLPKDFANCLSWKLSVSFESMSLICQMHWLVFNKFDSIHNHVAQHNSAFGLGNSQPAWLFLLVVLQSLHGHVQVSI